MKLRLANQLRPLAFIVALLTYTTFFAQSTQWEDSNGDIKTVSTFTGNIDLTNSALLLPDRAFSRPLPQNLSGTNSPVSYLYGRKTGLSKLYFPRMFIHNRTALVPQNEFIVEAYYHPALVLDNLNTGGGHAAEGSLHEDVNGDPDPRDGYQTSIGFRRESQTVWQLTSDRGNNKEMDFALRQWNAWQSVDPGITTERWIVKPIVNVSEIGLGELTSINWQNAFYGNTGIRGFVSVKALNNSNGRAAFAFEGPDANNNFGNAASIKRWIRQGSDPNSLEISDQRDNGKTFWILNGDGLKTEMTVQNDDGSNRLRMILGADSSETYLKQLYGTDGGRPFHIRVNNATLATFDAYGDYALKVNGDALADVWTPSDRRFKEDIKILKSSLNSIQKVSGVSYSYDQSSHMGRGFSDGITFGFIAQDFMQTFPDLVREDDEGYFAIKYSGMIPVLTEAIKELSNEKQDLEKRIEELETKLNNLASSINQKSSNSDLQSDVINKDLTGAFLKPNSPNPFTEKSTISYHLPQSTKQASLFIYDLNGNIIKTYENLNYGHGQIEIEANSLSSGIYLYTLVADGHEIGTHKMILKK